MAQMGIALVLCHQIFVASSAVPSQYEPSTQVCRPFNNTSGFAEVCGYNDTADFFPGLDEFGYGRYFKHNLLQLVHKSSCSQNLKLLECANYFPRCAPNVRGPFLPCKRVCHDLFLRCGEEFRNRSETLYWRTRWSCNLLPERDDPSTMDYRKRCFEPPGFKACDSKCDLEPPKCFPLVVPECQNFGYKFTIYPEKTQKEVSRNAFAFRQKHAHTRCADEETKMVCSIMVPPCFKDDKFMGSSCLENCQSFFKTNCTPTSSYLHNKESCSHFPMGTSIAGMSGICKRTQWYYLPGSLSTNKQSQQKGNLTLIFIGLLTITTLVGWLALSSK